MFTFLGALKASVAVSAVLAALTFVSLGLRDSWHVMNSEAARDYARSMELQNKELRQENERLRELLATLNKPPHGTLDYGSSTQSVTPSPPAPISR